MPLQSSNKSDGTTFSSSHHCRVPCFVTFSSHDSSLSGHQDDILTAYNQRDCASDKHDKRVTHTQTGIGTQARMRERYTLSVYLFITISLLCRLSHHHHRRRCHSLSLSLSHNHISFFLFLCSLFVCHTFVHLDSLRTSPVSELSEICLTFVDLIRHRHQRSRKSRIRTETLRNRRDVRHLFNSNVCKRKTMSSCR